MGMNPRFRLWRREDWQGYCPTIGEMARRGWRLTAHCDRCGLTMAANVATIIAAKGRGWSPWGETARCRRLHCSGRMKFKAYCPRSNEKIEV